MPAHRPCGSAGPARTALQGREGAVDPRVASSHSPAGEGGCCRPLGGQLAQPCRGGRVL